MRPATPSPLHLVLALWALATLIGTAALAQTAPAGNATAPARWTGPRQYLLLSTSDTFDCSVRNGKQTPNGYQVIHDTYGSFAGKTVAVGVCPEFRVFERDPDHLAAELKNHLQQSQRYKVPIFVSLSSFVFTGARPDLWNWWDKNAKGYDPRNVDNVEWTDWTPDSAVKIGWLNWGSQLRLHPMPNLMSPAFQQAEKTVFTRLGTVVKEWYDQLPPEDKWLFIGIKSTDEAAIGVNNWYYPNGNDYLDRDPRQDPTTGLKPTVLPSRGVQTIGYAAVRTAGLRRSGTLTIEDLNEVCRRHCEYSSKILFDLGFPRDQIFSSSFGKTVGECKTCLTRFSCPSWSFYHAHALDPSAYTAAREALEASDSPYWAIAEWGIAGNSPSAAYIRGLRAGLALPRCRFIRLTGEWFRPPAQATEPAIVEALKTLTK